MLPLWTAVLLSAIPASQTSAGETSPKHGCRLDSASEIAKLQEVCSEGGKYPKTLCLPPEAERKKGLLCDPPVWQHLALNFPGDETMTARRKVLEAADATLAQQKKVLADTVAEFAAVDKKAGEIVALARRYAELARVVEGGRVLEAGSESATLAQGIAKEGVPLRTLEPAPGEDWLGDHIDKVSARKDQVRGGSLYLELAGALHELVALPPFARLVKMFDFSETFAKDDLESDGTVKNFNLRQMAVLAGPSGPKQCWDDKEFSEDYALVCDVDPALGPVLRDAFNESRKALNAWNKWVKEKGGTVAALKTKLASDPSGIFPAATEAAKVEAMGKKLGDLTVARLSAVYDANKRRPGWTESEEGKAVQAGIAAAGKGVTLAKSPKGGYDYTYYRLDGGKPVPMTAHLDALPDEAGAKGLSEDIASDILASRMDRAKAKAMLAAVASPTRELYAHLIGVAAARGPAAVTGGSSSSGCGSGAGDSAYADELARREREEAARHSAARMAGHGY